MKWITRSVLPSMTALAVLVAFFPSSGPTIEVRTAKLRFDPAILILHAGDSVSVENTDSVTHTLTCDKCGVDTGNVQPGQAKTVKFSEVGNFAFVCRYHEGVGMTGRVLVVEKGRPLPTVLPTAATPPGTEPPGSPIPGGPGGPLQPSPLVIPG